MLEAINRCGSAHPSLEPLYDDAVRDTVEQFDSTGSPVITDGEQRKFHNFATYCVEGLPNTDTSTTREKAFAKIRSRVEGTALAEKMINGR